jgi:hypothetical protein
VNASLLACLALAPAPPRDPRFGTGRQEYDTRIAWKRGTEPDLAGYRVVWRATYSPFWGRGIDVGDVGESAVKGLSKDDLFFAVQAVDRDGNASLPAFPVPPQLAPAR